MTITLDRWMGRLCLALSVACAAVGAHSQTVRLQTSLGPIEIEMHPDKAPKTVANFLAYVRSGHFDSVIFHRVIDGFMVQTGGYTANLQLKPTKAPIPLESANGLNNVRGSVAMARTSDPNSATAQFFINVVDNPFLDKANARDGQGYAVFATVTAGMETVDAIRAVKVAPRDVHQHLPVEPVTIIKATVTKP